MLTLPASRWAALTRAHEERADGMTEGYRARRRPVTSTRSRTSCSRTTRTGRISCADGTRAPASGWPGPAPHAAWRWYARPGRRHPLDVDAYLARPRRRGAVHPQAALGDRVSAGVHRLLRPARVGDGLPQARRAPAPAAAAARRRAGTDAVVESHPDPLHPLRRVPVLHRPRRSDCNLLQPTRANQIDLEQPGCLHAEMDCLQVGHQAGRRWCPASWSLRLLRAGARHPDAGHAGVPVRLDVPTAMRPVRDRDRRRQGRVRMPQRSAHSPSAPRTCGSG